MCGWKSVWKYMKYGLKTENGFLKTQIKHPIGVAWFLGTFSIRHMFKLDWTSSPTWV